MEQGEENLLRYVAEVFRDFKATEERLEALPKSAQIKTGELMALFRKGDIFSEDVAQEFLTGLLELSEEIGHAYQTVLGIELKLKGLMPPSPSIPFPIQLQGTKGEGGVNPAQVILQQQPAQKGGVWDYMSARRWAGALEKWIKTQGEGQVLPEITTSKEVIDVLEFGRQLIPELNRTIKFFRQSLDHLYFFHDPDTKERFTSELQTHLTKICGIIRSFARTSAEHRIEKVGENRVEVAKGVIGLQIAQFASMGQMTTADFYRALRQAMGAQNAGER